MDDYKELLDSTKPIGLSVLDAFDMLDKLPTTKNSRLHEKLIQGEELYAKLQWFDSEYQFRDYLKAIVRNKQSKGYRLTIGENSYAVADAHDINHDMMAGLLHQEGLPVGNEKCTLGIPTVRDFEDDDYEIDYLYDCYLADDLYFDTLPPDGLSKKEFIKWLNDDDERTNGHNKVAVCDGFEILLYNYRNITEAAFKQTALGKALGPLFKYIKE